MDKNGKKLILAVVLLVVAGVAAAWSMGLFGGDDAPEGNSEAAEKVQGKSAEEAQEILDETGDGTEVVVPRMQKPSRPMR